MATGFGLKFAHNSPQAYFCLTTSFQVQHFFMETARLTPSFRSLRSLVHPLRLCWLCRLWALPCTLSCFLVWSVESHRTFWSVRRSNGPGFLISLTSNRLFRSALAYPKRGWKQVPSMVTFQIQLTKRYRRSLRDRKLLVAKIFNVYTTWERRSHIDDRHVIAQIVWLSFPGFPWSLRWRKRPWSEIRNTAIQLGVAIAWDENHDIRVQSSSNTLAVIDESTSLLDKHFVVKDAGPKEGTRLLDTWLVLTR